MGLVRPFEGISPIMSNQEINNHIAHMESLSAEKKVVKVVDLINKKLLSREKKLVTTFIRLKMPVKVLIHAGWWFNLM